MCNTILGAQRRPEWQPKCRTNSRPEHDGDLCGERIGNIYLSRDQSGAQSGAQGGDQSGDQSGPTSHGGDRLGERSGNISLAVFPCQTQPRHHCHQGHQGHSYDQEQNILGQISPLWTWLFCILYHIRYCLKYHPFFIGVTTVTPTIFIFRTIRVQQWRRQKGWDIS